MKTPVVSRQINQTTIEVGPNESYDIDYPVVYYYNPFPFLLIILIKLIIIGMAISAFILGIFLLIANKKKTATCPTCKRVYEYRAQKPKECPFCKCKLPQIKVP